MATNDPRRTTTLGPARTPATRSRGAPGSRGFGLKLLVSSVVVGLMVMTWATTYLDGGTTDRLDSPKTLAWRVADGKITGVEVTWTPRRSTSYVIEVSVGSERASYETSVMVAGNERTDTVPLVLGDVRSIGSATARIHAN